MSKNIGKTSKKEKPLKNPIGNWSKIPGFLAPKLKKRKRGGIYPKWRVSLKYEAKNRVMRYYAGLVTFLSIKPYILGFLEQN